MNAHGITIEHVFYAVWIVFTGFCYILSLLRS